jgi:hypothetical protein
MAQYREIIEEPGFREQLYTIQSNPYLADEMLDNVKICLAESPEEAGVFDSELDLWATSMAFYHSVTGFEVAFLYYTFDDQKVYLISIEQAG